MIMTSRAGHCEGHWHLCTCAYLLERRRNGLSPHAFCESLVRDQLTSLWTDDTEVPAGKVYSICQASCASVHSGPCAAPQPPAPPPPTSPPPPFPPGQAPPPASPSPPPTPLHPCTDLLPDVMTARLSYCGGDWDDPHGWRRCTCEYLFNTNRPYLEPPSSYCEQLIHQKIGHFWSSGSSMDEAAEAEGSTQESVSSAPQAPIYTICPATCAVHHRGPCAGPAPPSAPPSPAWPPFAPCTDQLPTIATTYTNYCAGSPCTCAYVFEKWRGDM